MAIYKREVKNKRDKEGKLTDRSGFVYDVYLKYKVAGSTKTYAKRGFLTKKEATDHEAKMRIKLSKPNYSVEALKAGKKPLSKYLQEWLEIYAKGNVRPSTYNGYETNIRKHINPVIGHIPLREISAPMLDKLYRDMLDHGYSMSTVKYVHRTLSVSIGHACRYQYIERDPTKNITTKFSIKVKTPDPYTIEQMQRLMAHVKDSHWEFIIMLGGLYGLRRNEILGLMWKDVDLDKKQFTIVEQLSTKETYRATGKWRTELKEYASLRTLPITEDTLPYFYRQQKRWGTQTSNPDFKDYGFILCRPNGLPLHESHISRSFNRNLMALSMPHIRFHDLRHTAATNMHQLTGDFYTVGEILGHSLKGIGNQLGITGGLEAITERYVDVRLERKRIVLDAYHKAIRARKDQGESR